MNNALELFLDLIRAHKNMSIIQSHSAHTLQSGQRTRHFIAVHSAKLGNPDRQLTVAVNAVFINHHMVRAVHRAEDKLLIIHFHDREHIFLVVVPVAGCFI
ncbi:Uncharacterised protein [Mycobacteroides abscessus subsp. abscessus]|nr:Uncharacterised protein [Mycobacteroides abscessus subsp. abscessus]